MEKVATTADIHQAAFFILNGAKLIEITPTTVNGKIICELTLARENITELQLAYLQGRANVNLLDFRRVFGHLCAWLHNEKKKHRNMVKSGQLPEGCRP